MVTLEARTYGLARHIGQARRGTWTIVNDVAGFIGPEVFRTAAQLERVCLEDMVMAKLHGLTMGLDVCATFHMGIAPGELKRLTERIVSLAAPAYLMAVAGNADPMLGYLTTSFREHPRLRAAVRRRPTAAMTERLRDLGATANDREAHAPPQTVAKLYAAYAKAGGDTRTLPTLEEDGLRRLHAIRERGFDLGIVSSSAADSRLDTIYSHARKALYAALDDHVIADSAERPVHVRTTARDRDDYLARPGAGEQLADDSARSVRSMYQQGVPDIQIVISDGLNANAVNEHLRAILPALRRLLTDAGHHVGESEVVVRNGRVRVGYEIGGLVDATIVIHLIGERPGTGMNTLSAYLTYGRDAAGRSRWSRSLDHAATTAICGIHSRGKAPHAAVAETARVVGRMVVERRSGVALASNRPL
jgi:ethanolamine ammonia-lyase large subunit